MDNRELKKTNLKEVKESLEINIFNSKFNTEMFESQLEKVNKLLKEE